MLSCSSAGQYATSATHSPWGPYCASHAAALKPWRVMVLKGLVVTTLVDYIDWGPFFNAWELAGRYPQIDAAQHLQGASAHAIRFKYPASFE